MNKNTLNTFIKNNTFCISLISQFVGCNDNLKVYFTTCVLKEYKDILHRYWYITPTIRMHKNKIYYKTLINYFYHNNCINAYYKLNYYDKYHKLYIKIAYFRLIGAFSEIYQNNRYKEYLKNNHYATKSIEKVKFD